MAQILDGKKTAQEVLGGLKAIITEKNIVPCLAIVLCGNNPESLVYTSLKQKRAGEIGIKAELYSFPESISQEELAAKIKEVDVSCDGMIIQLPLPKHLDARRLINLISPEKDVDGLTDISLGRLMNNQPGLVPATPKGVIRLLEKYALPLEGKEVVIINRSTLVGKPLAQLFLNQDATVTICHRHTLDIKKHTLRADVVVSAVGQPKFITADMVKEGAIVIDVGTTKVENKIVGDVDFEAVKEKASFITPVPGGIGPMTIAMLLENLVQTKLSKINTEILKLAIPTAASCRVLREFPDGFPVITR